MMDEGYNKFLCEKAGEKTPPLAQLIGEENYYSKLEPKIELLIKAMWALIDEKGYTFAFGTKVLVLDTKESPYKFNYSRYSNSKQEALSAALQYIYEQVVCSKMETTT